MKTSGWIQFTYKPPYSAIEGRKPPYDFPVLVAFRMRPDEPISYEVWPAKAVTEFYNSLEPELQKHIKAWQGIDEYEEPRG